MSGTPVTTCRVAATIVQQFKPSWRTERALAAAAAPLDGAPRLGALFEAAYGAADAFAYAPAFRTGRSLDWLGRTHGQLDRNGLSVTIGHMLVRDRFHRTQAIHQHVALDVPVDLARPEQPDFVRVVRALHELYWLSDMRGQRSEAARALDPLGALAPRKRGVLFASRHLYVSVLLDAGGRELVQEPGPIASGVYALLYLHPRGVDRTTAEQTLERARWTSARFFALFGQPDGLLSLAVPYPEAEVVPPWPTPLPVTEAEAEGALEAFESRCAEHGAQFEPYDLTPEFPCVRYNALAMLEFLANAQFGQWRIRQLLDGVMRVPWPFNVLVGLFLQQRVDRLYFRTTSLAMLRLPVVRTQATRLLEDRRIEQNEQAIDGMRSSLLNSLMALLAIVALVIAVVQLVSA